MKNHRHQRPGNGFTLVELLVVVSIIAVLAAMGFTAISHGIKKEKMLTTRNHIRTLSDALEQYYQSYGHLPNVGSQEDLTGDGEAGTKLLTILLGKEESSSDMQNPKGIAFLTTGFSSNRRLGGFVYDGKNLEGAFDAWGRPLNIRFDADLDQEIPDPIKQGDTVRQKNAIVWSLGADGKVGENDEVRSW